MLFTGSHLHSVAVNLTGESGATVMSVSHEVNLTLGTPRPILVFHSPVPGVTNLNTVIITRPHPPPKPHLVGSVPPGDLRHWPPSTGLTSKEEDNICQTFMFEEPIHGFYTVKFL